MNGTYSAEYRTQERESSDHLLQHDETRVLGRFVEAAYHADQAGRGRARMGEIALAAGNYASAAEDYLSAAGCFLQATATRRAAEILKVVEGLMAEGRLPVERRDLAAELANRKTELQRLEKQTQDFLRELAALGPLESADNAKLRFLQDRLREFPGYPLLHYEISRCASEMGQQELAFKHLVQATKFDPDNANYIALLGYKLHAGGEPDRAVTVGRTFLEIHSGSAGPVRIMLANALASNAGGQKPDQEDAIAVLHPLVENADAEIGQRIAALALSATFNYELGREQEFGHLLNELNRLDLTIQSSELRKVVDDFRRMLPSPQPASVSSASNGAAHLLPDPRRRQILQMAEKIGLRDLALAA